MKYGQRVLKLQNPPLKGDDVLALQTKIVAFGSKDKAVPCDGEFGETTELAVKKFQQHFKLKETGIADIAVYMALESWTKAMKPAMDAFLKSYKCKHGSNFSASQKEETEELWSDYIHDEVELKGSSDKAGAALTCKGFGNRLTKVKYTHSKSWKPRDGYRDVEENEGFDRILFWLAVGIMKIYNQTDLSVTNGYRCQVNYWRINEKYGGASMANHTGHAIDFQLRHQNITRPNGEILNYVHATRSTHCNAIRDDLEDFGCKEEGTIGEFNDTEGKKNFPRLEPRGVAKTWIHLDTTIYENHQYVQTVEQAIYPHFSINFPVNLSFGGLDISAETIREYYKHMEKDHAGGYYPVGFNTLWHGGVHLHIGKGNEVHVPLPGTIVAARLPESFLFGEHSFGSHRFILIKHEMNSKVFYTLFMHLNGESLDTDSDFVKKIDWLNNPSDKVIGYKLQPHIESHAAFVMPNTDNEAFKMAELKPGVEAKLLTDVEPKPWKYVRIPPGIPAFMNCDPTKVEAVFEKTPNEDLLAKLKEDEVVKLDIPVLPGDLLWTSGEHGTASAKVNGFDATTNYRAGILHWEIFSEENLFPEEKKTEEEKAEPDAVPAQNGEAAVRKVYVRKLTGPKEAEPGLTVTLRATEFSVKDPTAAELEPINWRVNAGETQVADKKKQGATFEYEVPYEYGGKTLTFMPYLNSPSSKVAHNVLIARRQEIKWKAVEDKDENYHMDVTSLLDKYKLNFPGLVNNILVGNEEGDLVGEDEELSGEELKKFYQLSLENQLDELRSMACKFESEWAMFNLGEAVEELVGWVDSFRLQPKIEPYLFWKEALGKEVELPESGHVWHYHPVKFMEALTYNGRVNPVLDAMPRESAEDVKCSKPDENYPYSEDTFKLIERLSPWVKKYSEKFEVPPVAVVGPIADEYNTRTGAKAGADYTQDELAKTLSHDFIEWNYETNPIQNKTNPVYNDIGLGNIKIKTAIEIFTENKSSFANPNMKYDELVAYIIEDEGTVHMAGLVIKEAKELYAKHIDDYSQEMKEAILVTHYKQGISYLERFEVKHKDFPYMRIRPGEGCRVLKQRDKIIKHMKKGLGIEDTAESEASAPVPNPE